MVQSWGEMMASNNVSNITLHVVQMMATFLLNKNDIWMGSDDCNKAGKVKMAHFVSSPFLHVVMFQFSVRTYV